jgi:hypothetical protein
MQERPDSDFVEVPFARKVSEMEELRVANSLTCLGREVALEDGWSLGLGIAAKDAWFSSLGFTYCLYHDDDERPALKLRLIPGSILEQRWQLLARIGRSIPSHGEAVRLANRLVDRLLEMMSGPRI